jgi:asparagine synthase (glutamine-hydrolysing)
MVGVVGGTGMGTRGTLDGMAAPMRREPWYGFETFEEADLGLGFVHHGKKDPPGRTSWHGGGRAGVVHGAITNRAELGWDRTELFRRVFDAPAETLAALEGPFLLAAIDRHTDRIVLGTDKLASRPCYYISESTDEEPFSFSSEVKAVLSRVGDRTVDEQAVSDMLLMGYVWGEKTLVREVRAMLPATVLEHRDGEVSTERYWSPGFEESDSPTYSRDLVEKYRRTVDDVAATIGSGETSGGDVGVWLSGGLDSRALVGQLRRTFPAAPGNEEHGDHDDDRDRNGERGRSRDRLRGYTYDIPKGWREPRIARRVANRLDLNLTDLGITPEGFLAAMDEGVSLTDGMLRWSVFIPITTVSDIPSEEVDIVFEAAGQGPVMGDYLTRHHLTAYASAAEAMYRKENAVPAEHVRRVMGGAVDPVATFEAEAARSDERTPRAKTLDAHFRNYYPRQQFANNSIARRRHTVRVSYVDGDLLSHAASMPLSLRPGAIPFTKGKIPTATTKPKLDLVGAIDPSLTDIPYERTLVAPKYPLWAHTAGFVLASLLKKRKFDEQFGGGRLPDEWYRTHAEFRERIDELLDRACERSFFDGEEIRRLRREHLAGEDHHVNTTLAAVSTVELWIGTYVDDATRPTERAGPAVPERDGEL